MADQSYMLHVQIGDEAPVPAPELTETLNLVLFDGRPLDVIMGLARLSVAMMEIREKAQSA